jgi:uncharacterized cupredoxin-like copper-binding protein
MDFTKIRNAIIAALVAGHGGTAFAHGDEPGHASPPTDYAKAEETPFGKAADPGKPARTIAIGMADTMRFTPSEITVKRGESVRFVAANNGNLAHEMVLGTKKELEEHAQLMRKYPGMEHDDPNMVHVAPGKKGEMVWQFTKPGEFYFACLQPGHFEAGMVGKVVVR